MGSRDQKELVMREPFDPCISRMRLNHEFFQDQPATECFGVNSKQTTTSAQRNDGHQWNSFHVACDKDHDRFWEAPGSFPQRYPGSFPQRYPGSVEEQSRLSCFEATPAVIIARPILMGSSPPRPLTNQRRVRGGRPDQASQQVTDF